MQEETVQSGASTPPEKPLEQQLTEALVTVEQQREAMMRALADAENARKRAQSDIASAQKYALERFAENLLPVMDSLEAALANEKASPEALREGVELTLRQLSSALDRARISAINPVSGERFDPHRHQAMAAVEANAEPNSIVAVMQKGYSLHDRILRPALVTVARAIEKNDTNPT
jgi:molecular chaperone GrpE